MNSAWQRFTLSSLPLSRWQKASYLHYSLVGLLGTWRQSSWLMQWSEVIAALLVSLVFGLAPFVPNALIGVLLVACASYWLLLTLSDEAGSLQAEGSMLTPIHLMVLLFWAIAVLATAFSPVKRAALNGLVELTLYLLLFVLSARVLRSPRIRSWLITLYLHVALIVSIYGVRQQIFGAAALATWVDPESPLAQNTRVYSYLGNPNLLAGYLLPAVVLSLMAVFAWRGRLPKVLALTMVVVNAACVYFTGSRGGWIGIVAALVVLIFLLRYWWGEYLPRFWRLWLLPLVLGSLAGLFVVAVLFSESLRLRVLSLFAGRGDSSNNFRINVWAAAIEMIRDRPLLGIGPGHDAFNLVYPFYQRPKFNALSAYSVLLEVTVETGFLGFACFIWLLVVTFNTGWQQLRRLRQIDSYEGFWIMGAIATLIGMLAHGVGDTVWYRPQVNTVWWLIMALIASYYPTLKGARD